MITKSASAFDQQPLNLTPSNNSPLSVTPQLAFVSRSSSLLFVDSSVSDYKTLVTSSAPGTEVHVLNSSEDAVTQITKTLLGRSNISSLHVVSHGEAGGLDFGGGALNLSDLPAYASQLQSWSSALTSDADILLYGCNVAQGESGKAFVNTLSQLTGADVAASNNLTGKDGDWNLEVTTGKIESSLAFDSKVTTAYAYDLNILGETFNGNDVTNPSWLYNTTGTQPSLTARSTATASPGGIPGGGSDAVGSGALRLTSAGGNQASFVIYNRPINDSNGLSITFNIHAYGGNGADGISFFLIDGNASPTQAGAFGGSLGYSSNGTTPGLIGGYLGIGFDEFGNFSNSQYGAGGPGARPDSIAVHGSQANNYNYLAGTGTLVPGIDNTSGTRLSSQKAVQIDLTPAGLLSVKIDLNNDGDFADANEAPAALQNYNVVASNGALPSTFKFGFSASTGGSTNVHEITGLNVDTFGGVPYTPLVNFSSTSASVNEGSALSITAQLDVATTNIVTVPVTLSGTATNTTDYTLSNTSITILPGNLTGSITLNALNDALVEPNETAIVTLGTPIGAQLSPQNNVFTATIVDSTPITKFVKNDFNGDGKSDILWRNPSTNQVAIWEMDGTALLPGTGFISAIPDSSWQIAGTGDFNADKKADILWRNSSTGQLAIWEMDGTTLLAGTGFISANPGLGWQVAGTGDFTGDKKADILWRNSSTGQLAIWEMDGTALLAGTGFISANPGSSWQISGTGDFNNDGKADILWNNSFTNQVAIWEMDGTTLLPGTGFISATAPSSWKIARTVNGTDDANGDGFSDIFWYNTATNQTAVWEMNGTTLLPGTGFISAIAPSDWVIEDSGDYNGDARIDLLWHNKTTNQVAVWELDGTTLLPGTDFVSPIAPSVWQVAA